MSVLEPRNAFTLLRIIVGGCFGLVGLLLSITVVAQSSSKELQTTTVVWPPSDPEHRTKICGFENPNHVSGAK